MSSLKTHLFLLIFLLKCFLGGSQTFNFKNYNTEQGLPQSQVLTIFQDHKGFMWFGTNSGGAARFDGNKFTTFNTNNGLIDNNVFSIIQGNNNDILFGTSKGLSVLRGDKFINYGSEQGLKNPLIYALTKTDSVIWLATLEGVYLFKNNKISLFSKDETLSKSSVYTIYNDKKGKIWFGTLQNGVIVYDLIKKRFNHYKIETESGEPKMIFSISQTPNGKIIIASQEGFYSVNDREELLFLSEIPGNIDVSTTCMLPYQGDEMYYGTQSYGLRQFNFKKNIIVEDYQSKDGLTNNSIMCLFKDAENNLWIGTDGAGVYKYNNNKFVYFNKNNGYRENYVTAVNVDDQNNIWTALKSSGLVKTSKQKTESFTYDLKKPDLIPDNNINSILSLAEGNMLFGTIDGLCFYNGNSFKTISENNFRHKYIFSLFKDSKNLIWIGCNDGLYRMSNNSPSEIIELKKYKTEGLEFPVYFITEDQSGKIWFGSNTDIYSFENNQLKQYKGDIESTGHIYSGIVDHKNNLWLGTEAGLFMFKNNQFVSISKTQNFPASNVNFLQYDNKKSLYVGTNNGIDIVDLESFYKGEFKYKHLGKDDGLLSLESNFNASAIDRSGRILVGTINGLEIYDPSLDKPNMSEAKINISDLKLFYGQEDIYDYSKGRDSSTLLPVGLNLPFTKNNLTFQYVGVSFIAPEKVMYQYKLQGIDEDWTPPVYKTEVTYPSLPPGTYTFMVKAMNSDGLWNKTPATFIFTISPPWYNTWWFYVLCSISLIGGIIFYNTYKTKKLTQAKIRLENIVSIRTKELRDEKEKVESINKEVIAQKQEIEHKNVEITDSIKYAKNIQEALLPSLSETEKALGNCFVLYQPKDIVSGDFFWYTQKNNFQFIAAADCTGHGVPGAFMSIVGNTLLNEVVNEKEISQPGEVLLELHKSLKQALSSNNTDSERRDGMDIALCRIEKYTNTIEYSGANRPLWIYRKDKDYELEIIKPTKYPIGGLELEGNRSYQNHSIQLFKGDCVYIFSDGFADQFGGPKGKKFMLSNMQKLISENIHLPMSEQKKQIKSAFDAWKNQLEQIDDVLVIGFKA